MYSSMRIVFTFCSLVLPSSRYGSMSIPTHLFIGIPLPTTSTERRKKERLRKLLQSIEKEEEDVFSPTAATATPTKKTAATPRPTTVSGGFAQQLQASTTPKRQSIW
eukprot:TRINITY_DN6769_c0_g1_i1.p1 TRINITY_DN6769_c0_g1~~TRINITY_DN6769_c0_g1_i1.p1  ORF type:complete len:107 (+),score=18.98 TRINITY_DN6769_c0_g1_i1:125-445(+)